jgi:hypothetical protein
MTQATAAHGDLFAQSSTPLTDPTHIRSTPACARARSLCRMTVPTSSAPTPRSLSCYTTRASAPTSAKATAGLAPWSLREGHT